MLFRRWAAGFGFCPVFGVVSEGVPDGVVGKSGLCQVDG